MYIFVKEVQKMYEVFEQLLQKFGITAYKVSKDTGIPQSTLSSWKVKRNTLSLETADIIAKYFGVTVDYLMGINKDDDIIGLNETTKEIARVISLNNDLQELFKLIKDMEPKRLKAYVEFIKAIQD